MTQQTLGFIGIGDMGLPMAGRLMDAGYSLVIHDVRAEAMAPLADRGANIADDPKAVADATDTIFVSLPTPDVVRAVALGDKGICPTCPFLFLIETANLLLRRRQCPAVN